MSDPTPQIQALLPQIRALIDSARRMAATAIDTLQVSTNFEIGRLIVEHEQGGDQRAGYGVALIKGLAASLSAEFGRGFSKRNLEYMRRFYLTYRDRAPAIAQTLSAQSGPEAIAQTLSAQSPHGTQGTKNTWALSWSHYVSLLSISNPDERRFYEIEAVANSWGVRELERQIGSSLYERLALSRDRDEIARLAREGQVVERAAASGQNSSAFIRVYPRMHREGPRMNADERGWGEGAHRAYTVKEATMMARREVAVQMLGSFLKELGYA